MIPFTQEAMSAPSNLLDERTNPVWVEGSRQRIEKVLREKLQKQLSVVITNNRHTMLSLRAREGSVEARLHNMFLGAPDSVLVAISRYLQTRDALSSRVLDEFIKHHSHLIQRNRPREAPLPTQGEHFELRELFEDINRRFFGGVVTAEITWGRNSSTAKYRSTIKLGSYSLEEKLIRIHPALDQACVPQYFIEWIVYHEMLHHVVPIPIKGNRRCFHSNEFRARERLFPEHEKASRWERDNLHLLLGF